ncbi:MAG: oligosaccharide flippase family protein [Betaproteobacteria bacterium]|nr:oligosaccharide flippase family protein [Betaproteobacteria bacterium]
MLSQLRIALNRLLPQNSFVRKVGVLAGGTTAAQAIAVLALPLLTRVYAPSDFGVLAIYTAIVSIVATIACLRLEIAIPLPEKDQDAANLLMLALLSAAAFGVMALLLAMTMPGAIAKLVGAPALEPYLWLVPFGIWTMASYTAIQYWATRKHQFSAIARSRLTQVVGGTGTQLLCGVGSVGPIGLLFGQMINNSAGIWNLARLAWGNDRCALKAVNRHDLKRQFTIHNRFPKYSTLESLANVAGHQVPILLIAAHAGSKESGFLILAMQIISAPMGLLGASIAQVFLAHASEHLKRGDLPQFTAHNVAGLAKVGILPLVLVGMVAPTLFPLVFGADWGRAGELLAWMTPWYIMQFITSPVSMVLHVKNQQKTAMMLQLLGCAMRVGMVVLVGWLDSRYIVEFYALSGMVFYAIYFVVVKWIAGFSMHMLYEKYR